MINIHPRRCRFSRIFIFPRAFLFIHELLDIIMRCISKTFHTCFWCFVLVVSNFAWLIFIKNVKLTSKLSKISMKINWKFNSNVLMSIQGVPVSDSPNASHLTRGLTRTCDKIKTCLYYSNTSGLQTWQSGVIPWRAPTHKVTKSFHPTIK